MGNYGYKSLQEIVGSWHEKRFPGTLPIELGLKAVEEMGEVANDLLIDHASTSTKREEGVEAHTPEEAADVVICLMALMHRFYPGKDLITEVMKKMEILMDADSGHRAAMEMES